MLKLGFICLFVVSILGFSPSIVSASAVRITTTSILSGTVGTGYNARLSATCGRPHFTWPVIDGRLPPGLGLSRGGVIVGRPTVAGTFRFTVRVRDWSPRPRTATKIFTITVRPPRPVTPPVIPAVGQIAFESDRDGNSEIYVMNADGTNLRRLTNHPGVDGNPDWSPVR